MLSFNINVILLQQYWYKYTRGRLFKGSIYLSKYSTVIKYGIFCLFQVRLQQEASRKIAELAERAILRP